MENNNPSDTPLTDLEEKFFYYELPRQSINYGIQRPGKSREGFVSSDFARKLERELRKIKNE